MQFDLVFVTVYKTMCTAEQCMTKIHLRNWKRYETDARPRIFGCLW